jgi:Holliday junction DNA helicase RuvA
MIGKIKGQLTEINPDHLILDVNGVGYEIHPHARALMDLQSHFGEPCELWIYTHVREDALQLFGFLSQYEKSIFLQLLKVSGVGPKLALNILSGAKATEVSTWIELGDSKALSQIPKVGKKTAEQIILTLQGKLVRVEPVSSKEPLIFKEIQFALVNLGFKSHVVEEFLNTLPKETGVEEGIRLGLTQLSKSDR